MAEILVPVDPTVCKCTVCGKEFEKDFLIVKDKDLCPECRKTYRGMAYVYCNTCKQYICRVVPGVAPSGFFVKPGDILHVKECPLCNPAINGGETVPEEQKEYEKNRRL